MAPNLVYFVLRKELLNLSEMAPRILKARSYLHTHFLCSLWYPEYDSKGYKFIILGPVSCEIKYSMSNIERSTDLLAL